jgi:hypothetical protein
VIEVTLFVRNVDYDWTDYTVLSIPVWYSGRADTEAFRSSKQIAGTCIHHMDSDSD